MSNTAVNSSSISASGLPYIPRILALREQYQSVAHKISTDFSLTAVVGRVLAARNFKSSADLENYLHPSLKEGLPDPKLLRGIEEACTLISEHVFAEQPIAICCDFDVDGLSGGAQALDFLRRVGAKAEVFVPDRFEEGYGLNVDALRKISAQGFKLLIAIDFGTTNSKELLLARELGLKTLVIDHHHVQAVPECDVFINPCQAGCGFAEKRLSAAGLVWYLILALRNRFLARANIDARDYLELACLGTICDMVPLLGANRVIAKRGLERLTATTRPGLAALRNVMGAHGPMKCHDVSFGIGPRINAAGRLTHAGSVIELLTTCDSNEAKRVARRLNSLNMERQETENQVKDRAFELLMKFDRLPEGIVVWDPDFHTGVVGIVAQRITERFQRPAVVLGADKDGYFKGSVRSVKGVSVVEVLQCLAPYLQKFGGHDGAGGLSIHHSRLEEFSSGFNRECADRLLKINFVPRIDADTMATLAEITPRVVNELESLAPFGMGNPQPQLLFEKLVVRDIKILKNSHLKLALTDGSSHVTGLWWRNTHHPDLKIGAAINVVGKPEFSKFSGIEERQIVISGISSK